MLSLRYAVLLALACASALAGWPHAALAAQPPDGPYYINTTDVNLRETPNGEVVLVFQPDEKVYLIKRDGDWAFVSAPNLDKKGWVYREYLSKERSAKAGDARRRQACQRPPQGKARQAAPRRRRSAGRLPESRQPDHSR